MATAWLDKGVLISEISESVGFKSGLCFSYERMLKFISEWSRDILIKNSNSGIRIRPEEYEDLYFDVLQGIGYAPKKISASMQYFSLFLKEKYSDDKEKFEIGLKIYELYGKWLKEEMDTLVKSGKMEYGMIISPNSYLQKCYNDYGRVGYRLALQLLNSQANYEQYSPWNNIRRVDWKDIVELEELFESESLKTYYGNFIDQRYIDYLSNNLDDIGEIQWRKFEGLTGEFFKRLGYEVTLGPGRNDGGIDVRVWPSTEDKEKPPMILIQCKRQKEKVDKVIVKALWADMVYEKAQSGLIVTSSQVSSGAKEDCKVRGYNIKFIERENLNKWIKSMRSKDVEIII